MERFLEPRTLARVRDLPLVARTVAEGFLHGVQPSHQRGVGVEFSQYRSYEPGDEPGRIDWKLYARSDRHFVREAERESEIGVWFVLDCSHSMAMRSEKGAWTRFDYALHLVATLAYIAQRQGDTVGLLAVGGDQRSYLPLAGGERHWHQLLKQLGALEARGMFPDADALAPMLPPLQSAGLVFLVSDFLQTQREWFDLVRRLSTPRNELAALQLLCADERAFPWRGPVRFEDMESGETVLVSGRQARDTYLERLAAWQEALQRELGRHSTSLVTFSVDEPMDAAVYHYLLRRQRQGR